MYELRKMQCRAALWITRAFRTSPLEGIKAIAGLIPIHLHLCKLNGRHHLCYASIPPSHAINSLLDTAHTKNQPSHRFVTSNLIDKQQIKLRSPIKDVNEHLNEVLPCFDPIHPLFSPSLQVVDHFSGRITFHSPLSSSNEDTHVYIQKLNNAFRQSQASPHSIAIIANRGIKKSNVALAVAHIWANNSVTDQLSLQAINIMPIEAELMSMRLGLIPALNNNNICDITVVTDSISAVRKILESKTSPFQKSILPIAI